MMTDSRGNSLGFLYIARRPCGKVSAMCWDDPGDEKDTAKHVARYIARGDAIERVERFANDPMPEMICNKNDKSCLCKHKVK